MVSSQNRISRQLPGPLVGFGYELYDEATMKKNTKLALGFPVTPYDAASDIVFIMQFLLKFHDIVNVEVSPRQLEALARGEEVAPAIHTLFVKLMGLVLNRKRTIMAVGTAISELRPLMLSQGVPRHWRTETEVPLPMEDTTEELLDPTHADILPQPIYPPATTTITYDVFGDGAFEAEGLAGIQPAQERLTMVRLLCQWSLSCLDIVKNAVMQLVHGQDIPGDKETYYAPRSILMGLANAQEAKTQAEKKLAKREDDVKYVDPTSNPAKHCYRLRLDELVVGDCGAKIGRFYLCRMATAQQGGLGSVREMKNAWATGTSGAPLTSLPTDFVLYVEDVHQMLLEGFGRVEGEHVPMWYRVASNTTELTAFLDHISRFILDVNVLRMYSYLSLLLPLLEKQERVEVVHERRSRRVNYSTYEDFLVGDESEYDE